jgi:hypothetical protein
LLGKKTLDIELFIGLIFFVFLFYLIAWIKSSEPPRQVFFNPSRQVSRETSNLKTSRLLQTQTKHFIIKYDQKDKQNVAMVADTAEEIYGPVTKMFGTEPKNQTMIIMYPDSASLAKAFGWDKDEKAMGVYWSGVIRILNPDEWIKGTDKRTTFLKEGPVAHEFAHLLVDNITRGNYSRWYTEGVAQFVEKNVTGFEFNDPFQYNSKSMAYYDFETLEDNFDNLDQSIAYWESLKATEFIAQEYGQEKVFTILEYLGQGNDMQSAFYKATGQPFSEFARNFYQSLEDNAD